jgi:phosphoglycolate phosphatase-like HAD superfamily hydrolase
MDKVAFIDLDGVVADSVQRFEKATKNGKINWGLAFHPPMLNLDTLVPGADTAITALEAAGWKIIYLSSRPERLQEATLGWLEKHGLHERDLLLRPTKKGKETTPQWKARMVCELGEQAQEVIFIDDEPENLETVQKLWAEKFQNDRLKVYNSLSGIENL